MHFALSDGNSLPLPIVTLRDLYWTPAMGFKLRRFLNNMRIVVTIEPSEITEILISHLATKGLETSPAFVGDIPNPIDIQCTLNEPKKYKL